MVTVWCLKSVGVKDRFEELWKSVGLVKNTYLKHGAKLGIGILAGGKQSSRNQ